MEVSAGDLSTTAITAAPISGGASGAGLDRLTFADGSVLVLKRFSPDSDWMMRATHDTGRAAELWVSGAMARLPPVIDPAIVRIERDGPGWRLYLRDVDAYFLRRGARVSNAEVRRFLEAVAQMHAAFAGRDVPGLASLRDLLLLTAPDTIAREDAADSPFLATVRAGWAVFHDLAPADVSDAVASILRDPQPLVAAMTRAGTTLVHADLHFGNVAPAPDRFYVIDWGLASQGPPAVDVAWFLDQSARYLDASREDVLAAFAAAEGPLHDARTLRLALLAEVVVAGWQYADAAEGENAAARRADLAWWVARAREGLDAL